MRRGTTLRAPLLVLAAAVGLGTALAQEAQPTTRQLVEMRTVLAGFEAAPTLLGREFSLNTTLLDEPFYALHLWAWHHNPLGLFANWNPLVSC